MPWIRHLIALCILLVCTACGGGASDPQPFVPSPPSEEEVTHAERQIAAFEAAEAEGQGVAVVDGKIVENLHVATAKATLAKAKAIAALETT